MMGLDHVLSISTLGPELLAQVRAVSDRIVLTQHPTQDVESVPAEAFEQAHIDG